MEILGVGPLELFFILIIALIVLGPEDMTKAGRTLGRVLRKIVMSPTWVATQQVMRNLRQLPTLLMREAGLEEELSGLRMTQEQLQRQVEEIRKARGAMREVNKEIEQETHTIHSDLGSWTRSSTQQAGDAAAASTGPAKENRAETPTASSPETDPNQP